MTKEILFMKPWIVRTAVIMNSSIFLVLSGLFGPLLSGMPGIVEARQGSLFVIPELKYIKKLCQWKQHAPFPCHKGCSGPALKIITFTLLQQMGIIPTKSTCRKCKNNMGEKYRLPTSNTSCLGFRVYRLPCGKPGICSDNSCGTHSLQFFKH